MKSVVVENGTKEVKVTVIGSRSWDKGENSRIYFDLEQSNKRSVFSSFYQVVSGDTRDEVIEVEGKTFAFAFGVDCNSNTKRESAREAAKMLAEMIAE